jgi:HD-like signal output (HDOD) protein
VNLAVGFLGIHETYRIALSLSVVKSINGSDKGAFELIWSHSVYTALAARYLKQHYEPLMSQGELWATAILHDIGKLVYLKFFQDHYNVLINYTHENGCFFHEAEIALGYEPSSKLGVLLANHWRLPNKVRQVCQSHTLEDLKHLDANNPEHAFPRMVSIANVMVTLATENLTQPKKESIKTILCNALGCSDIEFLVHMGAIYDLKDEVQKMNLSS